MPTELARRERAQDLPDLVKLDREINAFVELREEDSVGTGPLADLRFGVKEIIEQAGCRTPLGAAVLGNRIGAENAAVVDRVLDQGAKRTGTTRSTVLAIAGESGTRNPLDLTRSPGGSSAGSAAAVAAGFVDFALGTQTVGSIIRPASYCGVVGFKPTFDALPTEGVMRLAVELDHVGLLAKDLHTLDRVFRSLAPAVAATGALRKACLVTPWFDSPVSPAALSACRRLADFLETKGIGVEHAELPGSVTSSEAAVLQGLLAKGVFDNHRAFIEANAATLPDELAGLARAGARITPSDHACLGRERDRMRATMDRLVDDNTVIVLPSVSDLPPMLGEGTGLRDTQRLPTLLGWPAISLPFGTYGHDFAHLKVGVQLVAKPGCDVPLLELARNIENWEVAG